METQQAIREAAHISRSNGRAAARLWPLVALSFSTLLLAASAIRVVAASISGSDVPAVRTGCSPSSLPKITDEGRPPCEPLLLARTENDDRPPPPPKPVISPAKPSPDSKPKIDRPPAKPSPPRPSTKTTKTSVQAPQPPKSAPPGPPKPRPEAKRVLVRDSNGKPMVAKIHGQNADRVAVLLPDGRIGWPDGLVYTEKPFVATGRDEMRSTLLGSDFKGFQSVDTKHYLVLYQGSKSFAQASARLLEDLYTSLSSVLNKRAVPVHEAEFVMVAVIFKTEKEFRNFRRVAPDVQAYYEILTNRIYFYETSERDQTNPEVSALRKPQTVAHEGTHQILQNIGVQPRLSEWPLWLIEGLAEYCASPSIAKNGSPKWVGIGQVNLLHIATIRDLDDPLSTQVRGADPPVVNRDRGKSLVEYLVTRTELTPTDYALSWALTFHLATKRVDEFLDFVREMSELPPLEDRSPADHLKAFRTAFGDNLPKLEKAVSLQLQRLKQIDALPYYAVMFEQSMVTGVIRRSVLVSQSPLVIRQWIENSTSPRGAVPRWQILPHPTKVRAILTAEQWIGGG